MPPWVKWLLIILFVIWLLNINISQIAHSLIQIVQQVHNTTGHSGTGG